MGMVDVLIPSYPFKLSVLGEGYCGEDSEVGGSVTRVCQRAPWHSRSQSHILVTLPHVIVAPGHPNQFFS